MSKNCTAHGLADHGRNTPSQASCHNAYSDGQGNAVNGWDERVGSQAWRDRNDRASTGWGNVADSDCMANPNG